MLDFFESAQTESKGSRPDLKQSRPDGLDGTDSLQTGPKIYQTGPNQSRPDRFGLDRTENIVDWTDSVRTGPITAGPDRFGPHRTGLPSNIRHGLEIRVIFESVSKSALRGGFMIIRVVLLSIRMLNTPCAFGAWSGPSGGSFIRIHEILRL